MMEKYKEVIIFLRKHWKLSYFVLISVIYYCVCQLLIDTSFFPDIIKVTYYDPHTNNPYYTEYSLRIYPFIWIIGILDHHEGFFLSIFTAGLWYVTYKLTRDAKETAKQQLRAYLVIKDVTGIWTADGNNHVLNAKVRIFNSGQTPAHDVTAWIGEKVIPIDQVIEFTDSDKVIKGKFIVGKDAILDLETSRIIVSPNEYTETGKGERIIYVCGEIFYLDIFNCRQTTKFRLSLTGEGTGKGKFGSCQEGNTAT